MLNKYLSDSRANLKSKKTLHFVMGNEASDLDSMASSVAYAWFMEKTAGDNNNLYIPLINIPKEDFKLRTEAVYLFREAGIETANLLFADEIDLKDIYNSGNLHLVMIDHNTLAKSQEYLAEAVEEIIDHHKDEGLYSSTMKTIEPVGSCITLVTEKIRSRDSAVITEDLAILAAGTILLDTVNLSPDAGRVTPKDEKVIDFLSKEYSIDRTRLFDKLQFEKFNTSELSTSDILRKDYKEWNMGGKKCGFSSALISIENWIKKDPDLVESVSDYYSQKKLDLLFIMIAYTEPEFTRELILFSENQELKNNLYIYLQNNSLGLEPHTAASDDKRADYYFQKNAAYSRKKLQPVVSDFFSS